MDWDEKFEVSLVVMLSIGTEMDVLMSFCLLVCCCEALKATLPILWNTRLNM
jgi:hypothetical protein